MRRYLSFWWRYQTGNVPWDTRITPPELVDLAQELSPGRALDVGCGTGTNALYLAERGWEVTGIDIMAKPLRDARRRARAAGNKNQTRFVRGNATRLLSLGLLPAYDLAIDIGCGHALNSAEQQVYAQQLGLLVRPHGIFLAYMFCRGELSERGLFSHEVETLFSSDFDLIRSDIGTDTNAGNVGSAWYRFQRKNIA